MLKNLSFQKSQSSRKPTLALKGKELDKKETSGLQYLLALDNSVASPGMNCIHYNRKVSAWQRRMNSFAWILRKVQESYTIRWRNAKRCNSNSLSQKVTAKSNIRHITVVSTVMCRQDNSKDSNFKSSKSLQLVYLWLALLLHVRI